MPQTRYDGPNDEQQLTATRAKDAAARGHLRRFALWLVAMSLVMGVLTTIAVAWSAAAFAPAEDETRVYQLSANCRCRVDADRWLTIASSTPGTTRHEISLPPEHWIRGDELVAERDLYVIETAAGYPFRALYGRVEFGSDPRLPRVYLGLGRVEGGFRFGLPVSTQAPTTLADYRLLPVLPIPLGFLANTLIYGSAWGGIVFLDCILRYRHRRRKRRQRGQCLNCGYIISGAQHDLCPECGQPVNTSILRFGRRWSIAGAALALSVSVLLAAAALVGYLNRPKLPALYDAVLRGDVRRVEALLAAGADPDAGISSRFSEVGGMPPIKLAAWFGRANVVKTLLNHGGALSPDDIFPMPTLAYAIQSGSAETVQVLLEHGASATEPITDERGYDYPPLVYAALHAESVLQVAQALVEAGADVNALSHIGTPLAQATIRQRADLVRYLLAQGVDPNLVPPKGPPPLYYAHRAGPDIVRMLLEHGADVTLAQTEYGGPLANLRDVETARLLLDAGADVNLAGRYDGATPLHSAASALSEDLIGLYLERGAAVDVADREGMTPLTYAVMERYRHNIRWDDQQRLRVVQLLLDAGADVHRRDEQGMTALHHAANQRDLELCRLLLDAGADASVRDKDGLLAFDYARMSVEPQPELEGLLRKAASEELAAPPDTGG